MAESAVAEVHHPGHSEAHHGKDSEDPKAVEKPLAIGLLARDGEHHGGEEGEQKGGGEVRDGHFVMQFVLAPKGATQRRSLALFTGGDVVGIQYAKDVQQSGHQQKFGPVIDHGRGHHILLVAEESGAQEQQARA